MTYKEWDDGGPISLSQLVGLGAPLPHDFALITDDEGQHPVVILHRDVWLTVIDPCAPPPYTKRSVRFDEVEISSTTWAQARALCLVGV
jgi:hypothetical protein